LKSFLFFFILKNICLFLNFYFLNDKFYFFTMYKPIFTLTLLLFFGIGIVYAQPKTAGEPRAIAKTDEPFQRPAWSADGKTLSFTSLNDNAVWKVSDKGNNLRKVPEGAVVERNPKIANTPLMQQMVDDPRGVASKVNALESFSGYIIFNPVLSPAGDKIVFEVSRGKGTYICNADGSDLRSLARRAECATWTPDGKYIIVQYVEDDGHVITKGELHSIEVATGARATLFASDKFISLNPALSPDGKQLAFEEAISGVIYVVDIQ
jgi:Tol biopolymer transport system component